MERKITTIPNFSFRREWGIMLALFMALLLLCFFSLDNFCYWGDDYAAYINEAIAIADGHFDQQAKLNYVMHPSDMVDEAKSGELVYVWGYPLILSLVYAFAGFDRVDYTSIPFYKLPSVLALAGLAALLYAFYRRRMGKGLSFLFALLFCSCGEFFNFLDTLYSDLVFLFFAILALYLGESYTECRDGKKRTALALIFGVVLWFMYEIRFNGVAILFACAAGQLISLLRSRGKPGKRGIIAELLPYIVFGLLMLVSSLILAPATGNSSDMDGAVLTLFVSNLKYYAGLIWHWLGLLINSLFINPLYSILRRLIPLSFEALTPVKNILCALCVLFTVLGMVSNGTAKNGHLSLLIIVYIIFVSLLPYSQGLRYIYPLLPLILLFIGCVLTHIWGLLSQSLRSSRLIKAGAWLILAGLCFFVLLPRISDMRAPRTEERTEISSVADIYMQNAYSPAAIEVYNYIQQNTPEESVIAFFTPRGLYLNTQRLSIKPGANGHSMAEADYYLRYLLMGKYEIFPEPDETFEPVFENDEFILYRRNG